MKTSRRFSTAALAFALSFAALSAALVRTPVASAQQYGALERGYRTGYSDGYQSGWGDQLRGASADLRDKDDYRRADRAYITAYGALEDYRDGYQQGYESGYEAGYARQGFNSELPAGGVTRRGASTREAAEGGVRNGRRDDVEESESVSRGGGSVNLTRGSNTGGPGAVPSNVVLTVELSNRLTTDVSQKGDRFEARVVEPQEFAGAVVAGRLADVQRPGKTQGRALLQLDFEQIQMPGGGGWQEFSAQVIEVVRLEETGAGEVDEEGGLRGRDTTREDVAKVGGAAGVGAIIGAIAGGGKGAIIGAVIGGGAATGGVMSQRGKDIRLEPGQQLRIRVNK